MERRPRYLFKLRTPDGEVGLTPGTWVVGRTPNAGVYVPDALVSRRHALIRVGRDHVDILDLGSRNGTYVNGERVRGSQALDAGDRLLFGNVEYVVEVAPVGADDRYYLDDDETPLPARLIRDVIAERALEPDDRDDLEEATFVGRVRNVVTREMNVPPPAEEDLRLDVRPSFTPRVVLVLAEPTWAEAIKQVASIHENLAMEVVAPANALNAVTQPGPGLLLVDVEAAGLDPERVVRAWHSGPDAGRRVVLISSSDLDSKGAARAKGLGAAGFVRRGKAAILCVAQIRFHIQLSGIVGDR